MNILNDKQRTIAILIAIIAGLCMYCAYLKQPSDRPAETTACLSQGASFDANTFEEIESLKEAGKPMIIAFGADYCPTCVNYRPYVDALAAEYEESIIVKYIDTEKNEPIRYEYNIELIPSTIFYDGYGAVYIPSEDVALTAFEDLVESREYVSDKIEICTGDKLALDDNFEYGVNAEGELVYCKYAGLIEMTQLRQIAEELLAMRPLRDA